MSVFKRGEVWWYKFYFANKLIRESAKTTSKTLAKEAEKNRRRDLEKGYNGLATEDRTWRVLTFAEAAEAFLAAYGLRHKSNSASYMKYCIKHLKNHVGDMMLIEIGVDIILAYQKARISEKASPKTINEEVMVLLHIMRELGDLIRVKMKRDKTLKLAHEEYEGKALTLDQIGALYEAARVVEPKDDQKKNLGDTRSTMILPAISLALNATLRDSEARSLTWDQINFLKGILRVGRSKTPEGTGRTIPINSELRGILEEYRTWYEANVGPAAPELYLFPGGKNRKWNPLRPISSFKTSWQNVREKAGVKARYHDLRHTAITNLCESGASDETVRAIAGHVSQRMLRHYAHIRTEAKRKALEAIVSQSGSAAVTTPADDRAAS
ncbi:MAG TPA: site-specific integrase [Acidobacteriota bacterium]|nr:site-specific integrase [Acidobacteriota bacterium]